MDPLLHTHPLQQLFAQQISVALAGQRPVKMGQHHHTCCNKQKVKRGLWTPEEDAKLINYVATYGHGCWSAVPRLSGLHRCGKSCRLRWINYLRPDLKRGGFSKEEAEIIVVLHKILGNKWSQIAKFLPGRTDNEVKNFWNSSLKKRLVDENGDICRDFADSSSSSSVPTHVVMNPNNNLIPFQFQGMPNFHPNYPPPMQPATSYAPPPLYNLTPQNLPTHQHYQYPIIQQHPNFMLGPNPPNPVFMPSDLEAQADNNANDNDNNNNNMNCYDPNPPPIATETAAPFADAAQPPLCEGLAGIDIAGFMEEPPSPMRYLESLLADIESPILTPAVPSSSTPLRPCSSGSSFLDDAAFDSLWAAQP